MNSFQSNNQELPDWLRYLSAIVGAAIIFGAVALLFCPPERVSRELSGSNTVVKVVLETADVTTPFLVVFLAGFALLVFAINGLRFAKISAAGLSAEAPDAATAAKGYYEAPSEDRPKNEVTVQDKESPEPSEVPTGYLEAEDGKYAVYKLNELPMAVITDALALWPEGATKPEDLNSFEFATRKTGKGNHPWTIKFKGKKAVVVSYGGQGKGKATVAQQ